MSILGIPDSLQVILSKHKKWIISIREFRHHTKKEQDEIIKKLESDFHLILDGLIELQRIDKKQESQFSKTVRYR